MNRLSSLALVCLSFASGYSDDIQRIEELMRLYPLTNDRYISIRSANYSLTIEPIPFDQDEECFFDPIVGMESMSCRHLNAIKLSGLSFDERKRHLGESTSTMERRQEEFKESEHKRSIEMKKL